MTRVGSAELGIAHHDDDPSIGSNLLVRLHVDQLEDPIDHQIDLPLASLLRHSHARAKERLPHRAARAWRRKSA